MAVSRSPFSSGVLRSGSKDPNAPEENKYSGLIGTDIFGRKAGGGTYRDESGLKTTVVEEKRKLESGYDTALAKIATSNLDDAGKQRAREILDDIANRGTTELDKGGITGNLRRLLKYQPQVVIGKTAGKALMKVAESTAPVARGVQSAFKEYDDLQRNVLGDGYVGKAATMATGNIAGMLRLATDPYKTKEQREKDSKLPEPKASFGDWLSQTRDKDFRIIRTGRSYIDGTLDFVLDVATDPLTYVTIGAGTVGKSGVQAVSYVGRSGRLALAQKMLHKDMVAKYPELIGKFDEIASVGVGAIPKHIRKAEGLEFGLRFMGNAVPKSDAIASVISGSSGIGTTTRLMGSRALNSASKKIASKAPALDGFMTPANRAVVNKLNIGRGLGVADSDVVKGIAEYSAAKTAKGLKAATYNTFLHGVQDVLSEVKKAGVEDRVMRIADDVSLLATEPDPMVRELATRYRDWQDGLVRKVNASRIKFNADYGADMKLINVLEDYGVHHKMSPEAFRFAYGSKRGIGTGWFKDADLLPSEIGGKISAAMHRKYVKGEEFLGEVLQKGTIQEVNEIFARQYAKRFGEAPTFNFFETDLASIADSYAYSMAAARSREGYVRRLLDYGNDVAQVINKKIVPDNELVTSLSKVYNDLKSLRSGLLSAVNNGQRLAGRSAKEVLDFSRRAIVDKDKSMRLVDDQIRRAYDQLFQLETRLAEAYAKAAVKTSEQRGMFLQIHAGLIEEITNLKGALESGRVAEDAAYGVLKSLYLKMNPDAKRVPKKASVLHDKIAAQMGIVDSAELDEITKRLEAVRAQIDEYSGIDEQQLNDLADIERELTAVAEDFTTFHSHKMLVSEYSDSGFMFGTVDDVLSRGFDPSAEPVVRVFNTDFVYDVNGELSVDELAAMRNAMMENPDTVAVHALEPGEFHDMREPDAFLSFWNPEAGSGDAVAYALDRAGLDADVFRNVWNDVLDGNPVDPMFEEVYPELAEMVEFLYVVVPRMDFPEGYVDDGINNFVFNTIEDIFRKSVMDRGASAEEALRISRQMMSDFRLALVNESPVLAGKPIMLPAQSMYGPDNLTAEGVYSFLIPDDYKFAIYKDGSKFVDAIDEEAMNGKLTSPIHFTSDSERLASVLEGTYHSEGLESVTLAEAAVERGDKLAEQLELRGVLEEEAKGLVRQIGGRKAAGSRRVKAAQKAYREYQESGLITVTVNGKPKKVTREKALDMLGAKEAKLKRAQDSLDRRIAANTDTNYINQLQRRRVRNEERLAMLFDQRKVLERWNEKVGDALRADVEYLEEAILSDMPTSVAGTNSREWIRRVNERINNIDKLGDTPVAKAWDRVSTQLSADEARLVELEMVEIPEALMNVQAAQAGINGKLVDDIYDGWTALRGTGVQIPEEFDALIRPNVDRLKTMAGRNEFVRAYKLYNQIFKTYATMTPGFIVRNAMSATFMNKVAGVSNDAITAGTKAAVAWHRFGPTKWLDEMGVTDPVERELMESAYRAVMAAGRGIQADFNNPVIKGGFGARLADNWATKRFMRANEFTEDSLRLPMAIDTLRNGGTFDDAVYRISRYHFDYTDLSRFDETMKNFIPFWVWTTRNLPLQITEQILRPGAYNAYNNLKERNPVSADVVLPSWMQEVGALGLSGNFVLTPDMPMNRLDETVASFGIPRILGQANPAVKLPVELLLADKQLALDIPFSDKYEEAQGVDKAVAGLASLLGVGSVGRRNEEGELEISPKVSYALGNVFPPIAQLQRLAGGALGGKSTYKERALSSRLNWLGIPVREIGPRQERSELIGRQFKIGDLMKELKEIGATE